MLCFSEVPRFVSVTFASAMAAPLLSVTVPAIVPYTFWPSPTLGVNARINIPTREANQSFLRFGISFPPPRSRKKRTHHQLGNTDDRNEPEGIPECASFITKRCNSQAEFRYSIKLIR